MKKSLENGWRRQTKTKIYKEVSMIFLNSGIREERVKAHEFYKKHGYEQTGIKLSKKLS